MHFIETPIFTKHIDELLSHDEYAAFQQHLARNPEEGRIIPDTNGLRKVRWAAGGKGKRGGIRVIYYYLPFPSEIRLLLVYAKGQQDNMTKAQKKIIRQLNEDWR